MFVNKISILSLHDYSFRRSGRRSVWNISSNVMGERQSNRWRETQRWFPIPNTVNSSERESCCRWINKDLIPPSICPKKTFSWQWIRERWFCLSPASDPVNFAAKTFLSHLTLSQGHIHKAVVYILIVRISSNPFRFFLVPLLYLILCSAIHHRVLFYEVLCFQFQPHINPTWVTGEKRRL